jgi:hypothetical protein
VVHGAESRFEVFRRLCGNRGDRGTDGSSLEASQARVLKQLLPVPMSATERKGMGLWGCSLNSIAYDRAAAHSKSGAIETQQLSRAAFCHLWSNFLPSLKCRRAGHFIRLLAGFWHESLSLVCAQFSYDTEEEKSAPRPSVE